VCVCVCACVRVVGALALSLSDLLIGSEASDADKDEPVSDGPVAGAKFWVQGGAAAAATAAAEPGLPSDSEGGFGERIEGKDLGWRGYGVMSADADTVGSGTGKEPQPRGDESLAATLSLMSRTLAEMRSDVRVLASKVDQVDQKVDVQTVMLQQHARHLEQLKLQIQGVGDRGQGASQGDFELGSQILDQSSGTEPQLATPLAEPQLQLSSATPPGREREGEEAWKRVDALGIGVGRPVQGYNDIVIPTSGRKGRRRKEEQGSCCKDGCCNGDQPSGGDTGVVINGTPAASNTRPLYDDAPAGGDVQHVKFVSICASKSGRGHRLRGQQFASPVAGADADLPAARRVNNAEACDQAFPLESFCASPQHDVDQVLGPSHAWHERSPPPPRPPARAFTAPPKASPRSGNYTTDSYSPSLKFPYKAYPAPQGGRERPVLEDASWA